MFFFLIFLINVLLCFLISPQLNLLNMIPIDEFQVQAIRMHIEIRGSKATFATDSVQAVKVKKKTHCNVHNIQAE